MDRKSLIRVILAAVWIVIAFPGWVQPVVYAAANLDRLQIEVESVATGLDKPIGIQNAGDGSGWLFIVLQDGQIVIFDGTQLRAQPFLDITSQVDSSDDEKGLLGLAFHPDYATNGFFYVNYTSPAGETVVARYSRSADPAQADPDSETVLLTVPQPHPNHNGGQLAFGPDGFLYIGLGDGGGSGDPDKRAQDLGQLLGKILRIDVDSGSPYAIPPSNPFVGDPEARDEIWAYGLRNPWRFSFDRDTGNLWIGDVGQSDFEEIDFQPADSGGGENYGWSLMEGFSCFDPSTGCNDGSLTLPILDYAHDNGNCSVTGGFVYRGEEFPQLDGVYFYGDFCSGRIWGVVRDPQGNWVNREILDTALAIDAFGESESGELYFTHMDFFSGGIGELYRIRQVNVLPFVPGDYSGDGLSDLLLFNENTGILAVLVLNGSAIQSVDFIQQLDIASGERVLLADDFNGDVRADLLLKNEQTGSHEIVFLQGGNVLSREPVIQIDPASGQNIVQSGDLNGDGRADLVLKNESDGLLTSLLLNGTEILSGVPVMILDSASNQRVRHTGDFDGDGTEDFLLLDSATGALNVGFLQNGALDRLEFVIQLDPSTNFTFPHTGDFNADGKKDLLLFNTATGQVVEMLLDGSSLVATQPVFVVNRAEGETVLQTGRFNSDANSDLLIRNPVTGLHFEVLLQGDTVLGLESVVQIDPATGWTFLNGNPE